MPELDAISSRAEADAVRPRVAPRRLALFAAATGTFALLLQLLLTLQLVRHQGGGVARALWIYLDYFTVLTNALATVTLARMAAGVRDGLLARAEDLTAVAASIFIVALVYNLVLRGIWHPIGWTRVADELLHVVMPLLFLVTWWHGLGRQPLAAPRLLAWMAYPAGYLVYALGRGALDGRYPYPFLDVRVLGYPRVLGNATLVGLAFLLVGAALTALARWQARR